MTNSLVRCTTVILTITILQWLACKPGTQKDGHTGVDTIAIRKSIASSPVLSPAESISKMKLEDGFEIKLVAAEPLVNSPVAMKFDEHGRMWVCEMVNYMPDTVGTGEENPTGKIVILEDTNYDGVMDSRKVFMDGLVLPRALCLVEKGVLIAEPPNLWYVDIRNDRPGRKILIDSTYAAGGNPEHQANGLVRALDNWIYSANCTSRYRKKGSKWLVERTHSRGQWGISQDDEGRLFYNNNSQNLLGDFFAPGFGAANTYQKNIEGFEEKIVTDNKVYPSRPTPGVNRGYMEGVLDDSLRLTNFTAASGPVIYRGGLFGKEYHLNAFVGEPSANLIKRNILEDKGLLVQGKQAYAGREFLSSVDERFRPVTLYNGPDGALYVVDMYRGIIQHKTYLTEYLKGEIRSRKLTDPISCGRIYKIIPKRKQTAAHVSMRANADSLVKLLQHPNGWVRDMAQQLIVDKKLTQVVPALRQNVKQVNNPTLVNHSLWTLEGLDALQAEDIIPLINQPYTKLRIQALGALPSVITKKTYRQYLTLLNQFANNTDTITAPYVAFITQTIKRFDTMAANSLNFKLIKQYPDNKYVADAVVSTIKGREMLFAKQVLSIIADTSMAINKALHAVIENIKNPDKNSATLKRDFPKGITLYKAVCQTCHGADGSGIKSLAPPLNRSEWVVGDKNKLAAIILYGLTGPVKVKGKVYKVPEISGEMPGIGSNKDYSDEDIAQVIGLIRKSWNNNAPKVKAEDVGMMRKKLAGRQKAFIVEELDKLK